MLIFAQVFPEDSAKWNVTYHKSYKKLTVSTNKVNKTYYLYLCGKKQ